MTLLKRQYNTAGHHYFPQVILIFFSYKFCREIITYSSSLLVLTITTTSTSKNTIKKKKDYFTSKSSNANQISG